MPKKMLVVYYSWTNGNTEKIAEQLADACEADIEAACDGAAFGPSMEVQFDSTGGSQQVTPRRISASRPPAFYPRA